MSGDTRRFHQDCLQHRRRRRAWIGIAVLLVSIAVVVAELIGWPFLTSAVAAVLSGKFEREVKFQQLRLTRIEAKSIQAHLERIADGRKSGQFGAMSAPLTLPVLNRLPSSQGRVHLRDALYGSNVAATWSLAPAAIRPER